MIRKKWRALAYSDWSAVGTPTVHNLLRVRNGRATYVTAPYLRSSCTNTALACARARFRLRRAHLRDLKASHQWKGFDGTCHCPHCPGSVADTPQHAIMHCELYSDARRSLLCVLRTIQPDIPLCLPVILGESHPSLADLSDDESSSLDTAILTFLRTILSACALAA